MLREISIGRNNNCDIVIGPQYSTVSGNHAIIYMSPNGDLIFRDLSRNGSVVNGQMVRNAEVKVAMGTPIYLAGNCPLPWNQVAQLLNANPQPQNNVNAGYNQQPAAPVVNIVNNPAPAANHGQSQSQGLNVDEIDYAYINSWSWGAFWLTPIWGFGNGCWWAFLLCCFPLLSNILFGVFGKRWAWSNKRWDNFYQYKITQDTWSRVALIQIYIMLVIIALIIVGGLLLGATLVSAFR